MDALYFASLAHFGQYRWDNKTPYIEHLKAVVELLKSWKITDPNIINAGYLHDVLEDTKVTKEDLKSEFGDIVADLVEELTRGKNEDYFEHAKKMSPQASMIKIADIMANLTDNTSKKSQNFVKKRLKALAILQEVF